MKFRDYIVEKESTGLGADGLSKVRLKTLIYKETKKCTYNKIYSDTYWKGPQCIWNTFNDINLNWQIDKTEYRKYQQSSQMNDAKEWNFSIIWENDKGKNSKLNGKLTASGAGRVEDPLEKYDLVLTVF